MAIESAPDIDKLIRDSFDAYQRGDASTLDKTWSKDESVIVLGTAPDERWEGHSTIVDGFSAEMAKRTEESPRSRLDKVRAYREGDVGWAVTEGAFIVGDAEVPTRGSAVLHREDGRWTFVQWTFSVLVPDAALEPGSPLLETVAARR
jgi:ketosteroid isomerase-like protein